MLWPSRGRLNSLHELSISLTRPYLQQQANGSRDTQAAINRHTPPMQARVQAYTAHQTYCVQARTCLQICACFACQRLASCAIPDAYLDDELWVGSCKGPLPASPY